jgi:CheY-like chemotaxis protein
MLKKILVVEDNDLNRELISFLFSPYGYEIIEAKTGEEGIRLAKQCRPDLILMDIQLPEMDGYTAIKALRKDPEIKDTVIIAVTSFAMRGDREKIMACGCNGYVPKPIDTHQLVSIVQKALGDMQTLKQA